MDNENEEVQNIDETTGEVLEAKEAEETSPAGLQIKEYNTVDKSSKANRLMIFNAHQNAESFSALNDTPVNIVNVMAERGSKAVTHVPCQNTYLFTDDGKVYFTQSNGIAKTVNELVNVVDGDFKANTTNGYATVKMYSTPLANGRSFKQLKLVEI